MTQTSNTVAFTVSAATPAWWDSLAERTWTDIAGGSSYSGASWQKGSTLASVKPPVDPIGNDSPQGIIRNWDGACALQSRGEYIKACEGGHAAYYGNEIYALGLKSAVPAWTRIWGPTANADLNTSEYAWNAPFVSNDDGTPRTSHGWFLRVGSEGTNGDRIWLLGTGACGSGERTTDVWSIARASLGTGIVNPALWVYHGRSWYDASGSTARASGPSAYDPVSDQIMMACDYTTGLFGVKRLDVPTCVAAGAQATSGPQCPGSTTYPISLGGNPLSNSWSAVITNSSPRCWIAASPNDNELYVWNLESPSTFRIKTTSGGSVSGTGGAGAAYHAASRKMIVGGINIGTTLRTLAIPADPWNASSGFTWGTITSAGGSLSAIDQFQGTFSQFQMINDMGDGRACIVMHTRDPSLPTYVYKLPASP